MRHKIECNRIANGTTAFNNGIIPRISLLNRFTDVLRDGTLISSTKSKRSLFVKKADKLLSERSGRFQFVH